uniref:Reticulon-like protein n=1 Tax=Oryza punctata TaxID=4537 RepID=A0A0E0KJR8_ORYPU
MDNLYYGPPVMRYKKMSEHSESATEKIMSSIMDTIAENLPKQKSGKFDVGAASDKMKDKLFGRQKTIHRVLGGGKPADVLLWRNKKISSSVLALATAIWVFFEWLDYHFLTIVSFALVLGMVVQFVWSNFSSALSGSPSKVPRVELPEELFVNIAVAVGNQDVSCERNLKHFVLAIVGLWAAAVIGGWCNFLTVIYIGFVSAHTLPVLYEKYEDQVDDFLYNVLGLLHDQYQKLDQGVLSKIPKGNMKFKKSERPRKPKRRNAMEKKLSILVCLVVLLLLAVSGHGLRILHDVDGDFGQGFAFGSKAEAAAAAAAETEPLDPSLDDYENEMSHVEFEPVDTGSTPYAAADDAAAAAAPAPGPAAEAGSAAGSDSMKWWLPPSTIPSFPLFPGMPGLGMPLPGIPFKPIGWGSPAAPGQSSPDPPADGDTEPSAASQVIN